MPHDWQREAVNSTDVLYDELRQLRAWCDSVRLTTTPIDVASKAHPLLRGLLIFNAPASRLDALGTVVLLLPRVSTGRMPRNVSTWALGLREMDWEIVATRGADDAIERLCAMGYG